jgi:hypothetical protein
MSPHTATTPPKETPIERFEEWAILELFGHQRLAGLVTEVQLGGASFVRVDVPEKNQIPNGAPERRIAPPAKIVTERRRHHWKLTKFYNPAAIYAISPVTEATARLAAIGIAAEPVTRFDVSEMVREAKRSLRPAAIDEEEDYQ